MAIERDGRRPWFASTSTLLVVILLVAGALRVAALDKPFYVDEMTTLTVASQDLGEMARVMRLIDASPALYPLLLHGWMQVSGSDAWVRLLSAVCGWLAVVMVWRLTRATLGERAALAAAAVMAVAPAHVHYAQYVRSYSLFTLLVATHLYLFHEWMTSPSPVPRRRQAMLVLVTAALLYTHYLSLFLFPVEGLWALLSWSARRPRVLAAAALLTIGGLLFLPGVPLLLHNMRYDRVRNAERPERPPLPVLVPTLVAELGVGQRALGFDGAAWQRPILIVSAVGLPTLACLGMAANWRARRNGVLLLALVATVPLALYIGSGRRLVAVRFFLPFMTGYIALIGAGLASMRRSIATLAGLGVFVMCAVPLVHFFHSFEWSYDHRRVAGAIASAAEPGDVILVVHPFESFYYRWYLGASMPIEGLVFTPLADQASYVIKPPPMTLSDARNRVAAASSTHTRLWVIGQTTRSFASDPTSEEQLFAWLDAHCTRLDDLSALTGGDPRILLYAARSSGRTCGADE